MKTETVERMLREQAWGRAKAELYAMRHTFNFNNARPGQFEALDKAINAFVHEVESDSLSE